MKTPFPWYTASRSGGGWFVKLNGEQNFLGKHPDDAPKPKKGRDGRWKPPQVILDKFYKLMALRDTASKSDYLLETVCALYLMELAETHPFYVLAIVPKSGLRARWRDAADEENDGETLEEWLARMVNVPGELMVARIDKDSPIGKRVMSVDDALLFARD